MLVMMSQWEQTVEDEMRGQRRISTAQEESLHNMTPVNTTIINKCNAMYQSKCTECCRWNQFEAIITKKWLLCNCNPTNIVSYQTSKMSNKNALMKWIILEWSLLPITIITIIVFVYPKFPNKENDIKWRVQRYGKVGKTTAELLRIKCCLSEQKKYSVKQTWILIITRLMNSTLAIVYLAYIFRIL